MLSIFFIHTFLFLQINAIANSIDHDSGQSTGRLFGFFLACCSWELLLFLIVSITSLTGREVSAPRANWIPSRFLLFPPPLFFEHLSSFLQLLQVLLCTHLLFTLFPFGPFSPLPTPPCPPTSVHPYAHSFHFFLYFRFLFLLERSFLMLCHFFTPFWGTVTHVRTFSRFLRVLLDFCMFCFVCFVFFFVKAEICCGSFAHFRSSGRCHPPTRSTSSFWSQLRPLKSFFLFYSLTAFISRSSILAGRYFPIDVLLKFCYFGAVYFANAVTET